MADIRPGTINTGDINNAHRAMRSLITLYHEAQRDANDVTLSVRENWVGKARNEFESQYKLLIKKIDDFGDVIQELYDALVKAEKEYEDADLELHQQLEMALGK